MLRIVTVLLAGLIVLTASRAGAHDVPNDVTIQVFLKPDGRTLRLLVRVPLASLQDVDYPRRGAGMLDLARADPAVRGATQMWVAHDGDGGGGESHHEY